MVTRIAMWSGPRNISTALMRSFGSRPDTHVSDEPLYAHYLRATGLDHPKAAEIVATHECDWRKVAAALTGPVPGGRAVWYQKHMAHHLLPGIERDWLEGFEHAFLIREPRAMLASLAAKLEGELRLADTGLPQQVELFEWLADHEGEAPAVVDARDVQERPAETLRALCARLGIEYTERMLRWEPGPRPTDGCWAPHWYGGTLESTGFAPYRERTAALDGRCAALLEPCEALYRELARHALRP
jgi:hypothetical protein